MIKIIVVDDSETARQKIKNDFDSSKYQTIEAVNGLDGMQKIEADPEIRLVICDVNMPVMNGLEMCEKLAEKGRTSSLTILMLTTETSPEMKERGKKAGVRAWVTKPYSPEKLVQAVEKITGSWKS